MQRWNTTVPCPRPDCEGQVRVYGYYDHGVSWGRVENCYPPEGESNADACDTCGADDWTEREMERLTDAAEREGCDDYDGPDTQQERD